jgi:hypothetical protein
MVSSLVGSGMRTLCSNWYNGHQFEVVRHKYYDGVCSVLLVLTACGYYVCS